MRRSKSSHPSQAGFTYLWLLFVVAVLGLGMGLAAEVASTVAQREKEQQLISIGRQFRAALGRYYEAQLTGGRHTYPSTLEELLQDPRVPGVRRHLRKVFVDPMTGQATWGLLRVDGRIVGVYSLSTRKAVKQEGFEADESSFAGKATLDDWVFTYPPDLLQRGHIPK